MFNNYKVQKSTVKNKPSMSLNEYCDLNSLNTMSVKASFHLDTSILPAFNRRSVNYYHVDDLNSWVKRNTDKVNNFKARDLDL